MTDQDDFDRDMIELARMGAQVLAVVATSDKQDDVRQAKLKKMLDAEPGDAPGPSGEPLCWG